MLLGWIGVSWKMLFSWVEAAWRVGSATDSIRNHVTDRLMNRFVEQIARMDRGSGH